MSEYLAESLISFYRPYKLYSNFGQKEVQYLCHLSSRYACSTLSDVEPIALEAYALWLSLVWLIDGLFDKCRSLTCSDDIEILIQIFSLGRVVEVSNRDGTLLSLFEVVQAGYSRYLDLSKSYREAAPRAFEELNLWTIRYFRTIVVPSSGHQRSSSDGLTPRGVHHDSWHKRIRSDSRGSESPSTTPKKMSLTEYTKWRLDSGAIMCVVWQALLFKTGLRLVKADEETFRIVAVVVSYYNDIVSYHRDLQQETPNLVTILRDEDDWIAMAEAVNLTNLLYEKAISQIGQMEKALGSLCLNILEGSYKWTASESRYSDGMTMLKLLKEGDKRQWYSLLFQKEVTPGDPRVSPKKERSA